MGNKGFICDKERVLELVPVAAAPLDRHVFVCNGKSCSALGSAEVKAEFQRQLRGRELEYGKEKKGRNPSGSILLTDCGSVGLCAVGTAVLVYPEGVWYAQVRAEDVAEIVEKHLVNGEPVGRLEVSNESLKNR